MVPVGAEGRTEHSPWCRASSVSSGRPVCTYHKRRVWSRPPETMRRPSGLQGHTDHRALMPDEWHTERPASMHVPQAQCLVNAARDDAAPVGLKATLTTGFPCPSSGAPSGWLLCESHKRRVWSQLPETMRLPSGLKATLDTEP